jgi:hypothetical protein
MKIAEINIRQCKLSDVRRLYDAGIESRCVLGPWVPWWHLPYREQVDSRSSE